MLQIINNLLFIFHFFIKTLFWQKCYHKEKQWNIFPINNQTSKAMIWRFNKNLIVNLLIMILYIKVINWRVYHSWRVYYLTIINNENFSIFNNFNINEKCENVINIINTICLNTNINQI